MHNALFELRQVIVFSRSPRTVSLSTSFQRHPPSSNFVLNHLFLLSCLLICIAANSGLECRTMRCVAVDTRDAICFQRVRKNTRPNGSLASRHRVLGHTGNLESGFLLLRFKIVHCELLADELASC